mmetsp:Transcript_26969/g.58941  ORF Transcript_26969/g.58941 Transcript_26969/m.58941 type:complete len:544 (+) Transcript_26969:65-1696(+)
MQSPSQSSNSGSSSDAGDDAFASEIPLAPLRQTRRLPRGVSTALLRSQVQNRAGRPGDGEEGPSDETLRDEYNRLEQGFFEVLEQDRADVNRCLVREKKFTANYFYMSINRLWAKTEGPVSPYGASVAEYKDPNYEIWPRGRHLSELSFYGQIWDFFRFMWQHTKPYKTVAYILVFSVARPLHNALLAYVTQRVTEDPQNSPLWLFYLCPLSTCCKQFIYWRYQMSVPLNSQRVQLRSVLLSQRVRFGWDHPIAQKWTSGRFTALLKDIDEVINAIWQNCLNIFDDMVTLVYLVILVYLNLIWQFNGETAGEEDVGTMSYGIYFGLFFGLGMVSMGAPFLWFHFFYKKVQECEEMIREGQSLYMSCSSNAVNTGKDEVFIGITSKLKNHGNSPIGVGDVDSNASSHEVSNGNMFLAGTEGDARKAFWIFGRTTFRSFFHRLAWENNFTGVTQLTYGPIIAWALLTMEGFGEGNVSSILIVLSSLGDLVNLSSRILDQLVQMCRGSSTLLDVAEILNADIEYKEESDVGIETGGSVRFGTDDAC